jgi:caffeoyl-CoA O-methyltransferase
MAITNEQVELYMQHLMPAWTGDARYGDVFAAQEVVAERDSVPILNATSVGFLRWLVQLRQPQCMLEVGTAIGYSGLHLLQASPTATLVTLELDEARASQANAFFEQANVSERVKLIVGDATETLDQVAALADVAGCVDFVFIDAAKGAYATFIEKAVRVCKPGALIVSDNILFRGLVAEPAEVVHRRHRSMVGKIKDYNKMLMEDERFDTVIVPIGDGLALSVLKEGKARE